MGPGQPRALFIPIASGAVLRAFAVPIDGEGRGMVRCFGCGEAKTSRQAVCPQGCVGRKNAARFAPRA